MLRKIYHGSSRILRSPAFGAGTARNDYGLGFYCTESPSLAAEWAVSCTGGSAGSLTGSAGGGFAGRTGSGYINRYTIETDGLRIINLNSAEYCILHWLAILLNFREFDAGSSDVYRAKDYIRTAFNVDYQNCDCMIGFRADNSNFLFAQSFLDGDITYRQFNDAVRLGDTGRQFVLKSNRAFDRILFDGYDIVRAREAYPAAVSRDRKAMERFYSLHTKAQVDGGLYISQIVSENLMPSDPRLSY